MHIEEKSDNVFSRMFGRTVINITINLHQEPDMAKSIDDQLAAISTQLASLSATGVKVDFTPVLTALTGIQNTANAIQADIEPSPAQVPTVASVSPANGSVNGGETITVTGTNFTGATGVLFGSVAGTNLLVQSDTSLTVVSPAQPAAVVDVTVVDAAGTSAVNSTDKYTLA